MLGFFRRARTRSAAPRRRVTLHLEALEWRYQLDGAPGGPPEDQGDSGGVTFAPANAAPVIVDFHAEQLANGLFLITGKVVDENPNGLVVTFDGSTSAKGKTAVATPDGTFSVTLQLRTDGTDSGLLGASTVDAQGLKSEDVLVFLDPTPSPTPNPAN